MLSMFDAFASIADPLILIEFVFIFIRCNRNSMIHPLNLFSFFVMLTTVEHDNDFSHFHLIVEINEHKMPSI